MLTWPTSNNGILLAFITIAVLYTCIYINNIYHINAVFVAVVVVLFPLCVCVRTCVRACMYFLNRCLCIECEVVVFLTFNRYGFEITKNVLCITWLKTLFRN